MGSRYVWGIESAKVSDKLDVGMRERAESGTPRFVA